MQSSQDERGFSNLSQLPSPNLAESTLKGEVRVENGALEYKAADGDSWRKFSYSSANKLEAHLLPEPAVYHHDIRDKLIADSPQGHYSKALNNHLLQMLADFSSNFEKKGEIAE